MSQTGNEPLYITLLASIRQMIASRYPQVGDRIPSERELARQLKAAPMTVRRALATLVEEGILERRVGSGTYIAKPIAPPIDIHEAFSSPLFGMAHKPLCLTMQIHDTMPHQLICWEALRTAFAEENPGLTFQTTAHPHPTAAAQAPETDCLFLLQVSVPYFREHGLLRMPETPFECASAHPSFAPTAACGAPFTLAMEMLAVNRRTAGLAELECDGAISWEALLHALDRAQERRIPNAGLLMNPPFLMNIAAPHGSETREGQLSMADRTHGLFEQILRLRPEYARISNARHQEFMRAEAMVSSFSTAMVPMLERGVSFPYCLRTLPVLPGNLLRLVACLVVVSATTKHPEAAERLARFLGSETAQRILLRHRYAIPARTALLEEATEEGFPALAVCREGLRRGRPFAVDGYRSPEYMDLVFAPIANAILDRTLPLDTGMATMREWTARFHAGEIGYHKQPPSLPLTARTTA